MLHMLSSSVHHLGENEEFSEAFDRGGEEAAITSGDGASGRDVDGLLDPAANRVTSALELMETLVRRSAV